MAINWPLIIGLIYILGFLTSLDALMSVRTPQGSVAWIISLNTMPIISVPLYWIFGRSKFKGYVNLRKNMEVIFADEREEIAAGILPFQSLTENHGAALAGEKLAMLPYLRGNSAELLVDGHATFDSIFDGIDRAEKYILVEFFIIRDDELGLKLKRKLIDAHKRGVKVWCLFDEVGSLKLKRFIKGLHKEGIKVQSFNSRRGAGNAFQLNFRNHRKIVVVDGQKGWVGGHNVGVEYLGQTTKFKGWRDTHMKIVGPAVLAMQLVFIEDWFWSAQEILDLDWKPQEQVEDVDILILPSGPADEVETCSLMFQQAIFRAEKRLWLASPYFVPDEAVLNALLLAKKRGVDVKVLIPDQPDHILVYMSAYDFLGTLLSQGIEVYRYEKGFMHQKVFLIDDDISAVGTANLDNRSMRLNFEITALIHDLPFAREVEKMLAKDFSYSRRMTLEDVNGKPTWFKVAARASYLAAPVQ